MHLLLLLMLATLTSATPNSPVLSLPNPVTSDPDAPVLATAEITSFGQDEKEIDLDSLFGNMEEIKKTPDTRTCILIGSTGVGKTGIVSGTMHDEAAMRKTKGGFFPAGRATNVSESNSFEHTKLQSVLLVDTPGLIELNDKDTNGRVCQDIYKYILDMHIGKVDCFVFVEKMGRGERPGPAIFDCFKKLHAFVKVPTMIAITFSSRYNQGIRDAYSAIIKQRVLQETQNIRIHEIVHVNFPTDIEFMTKLGFQELKKQFRMVHAQNKKDFVEALLRLPAEPVSIHSLERDPTAIKNHFQPDKSKFWNP